MKQILSFLILVLFSPYSIYAQKSKCLWLVPNDQKATSGSLESFKLPFSDSITRQVVVWLPADYNLKVEYATIYMHDDDFLFEPCHRITAAKGSSSFRYTIQHHLPNKTVTLHAV